MNREEEQHIRISRTKTKRPIVPIGLTPPEPIELTPKDPLRMNALSVQFRSRRGERRRIVSSRRQGRAGRGTRKRTPVESVDDPIGRSICLELNARGGGRGGTQIRHHCHCKTLITRLFLLLAVYCWWRSSPVGVSSRRGRRRRRRVWRTGKSPEIGHGGPDFPLRAPSSRSCHFWREVLKSEGHVHWRLVPGNEVQWFLKNHEKPDSASL